MGIRAQQDERGRLGVVQDQNEAQGEKEMNQFISPDMGNWLATNAPGILILAAVFGIIILILERATQSAENLLVLSRIRQELESADEHAQCEAVDVGDVSRQYYKEANNG
jgi:hypothetical protein